MNDNNERPKTIWHQRLVENIYAINTRLKQWQGTFDELCSTWGGFNYQAMGDELFTFDFRVDEFEFTIGCQKNKCILLGEAKLWLEREKYWPFELMSINLVEFIRDNKLKLD